MAYSQVGHTGPDLKQKIEKGGLTVLARCLVRGQSALRSRVTCETSGMPMRLVRGIECRRGGVGRTGKSDKLCGLV